MQFGLWTSVSHQNAYLMHLLPLKTVIAILPHWLLACYMLERCHQHLLINILAWNQWQGANCWASVGHDTTKRKPTHRNTIPCLCLWLKTAESTGTSKFTACVIYLPSFLCFCPGGDTCSQNGGEDVTSRQHDRGGRHGPPRTPEWRFIPREPEETLRPQWDLRKPPFLCLAATASIWLSFIQAAVELYSVVCMRVLCSSLPSKTSKDNLPMTRVYMLLFLHSLTDFIFG